VKIVRFEMDREQVGQVLAQLALLQKRVQALT
jgi:hypothetical protein